MVAKVLPIQKPVKVQIFRTATITYFFKTMLIISQIFCAAPLLDCKRCFLIKLHFIWSTLIVVCIIAASWSLERIFEVNMTTIKKALYFSEYFADAALIVLTIITCYYHKDCYETFPKRIQELEKRTQIYKPKAIHQEITHKVYKKIMKIVVIGASLLISTTLIDFFYNAEDLFMFLKSTIVFILPNITIFLWIGQYWILLTLILTRYEVINSILEDLNSPKIQQTTPCLLLTEVMKGHGKPRSNVPAILEDLRCIFAHLEVLVGDVTEVFGLTITANFLSAFLTLSVQIFVLYKMPERPEECTWSSVLYALFWVALNTLKFFVILYANSCLLNVKSQMGIILSCFEGVETKTEEAINRFLMQLVVRNNIQMACGIVDLDMELIGGLLSALSIYVIFLIQIDLGEIILITRPPSNITSTNIPISS
ncbi:putative gustatory receptor 59e [Eupeodes corollae]|uniref:putative gustatory receptor 59e n=1 Tax=Eupeodes corollae TaxID=290404 RepID=UPI0024908418|nr:putative gustatory receptor 59e [Eupeodes corollae]